VGLVVTIGLIAATSAIQRTDAPPSRDGRLGQVIDSVSAGRIERDVRTLVGFHTRHTLSDTVSTTRGIGAARRWLKAQFDSIAVACGGCLDVFYMRQLLATHHLSDLGPLAVGGRYDRGRSHGSGRG